MFAVLAALLVFAQTSGLVHALDRGPVVECCCGVHSADKPCDCPTCPSVLKLRHRGLVDPDATDGTPRLRACHSGLRAGILSSVPMLQAPPPPALLPLIAQRAADTPEPPPLHDRFAAVSRPPP